MALLQIALLSVIAAFTVIVYVLNIVRRPPPETPAKTFTYRAQGIPIEWDKHDLEKALKKHFAASGIITIKSLFKDIIRESQVSTIIFEKPPPQLRGLARGKFYPVPPLYLDSHFSGLTVLYAPPAQDHVFDVIFVPGLGGHAFASFMEKDGNHMWPRDFLPPALTEINGQKSPIARITVYGYDATIQDSQSVEHIGDIAMSLQASLKKLVMGGASKPIIFVGHSMGGIVIKEALISLSQSKDENDARLFRVTRGIVFFGVPHTGMKIESLRAMVGDNPNRQLIESLCGENSQFLKQQRSNFSTLLNANAARNIKIISFYETVKWTVYGKGNGPRVLLVPVSSAELGLRCEKAVPIGRSHSEMVKFGPHDDEWHKVSGYFQEIAGQVRDNVKQEDKSKYHEVLGFKSLDNNSRSDQLQGVRLQGTCEWLVKSSEFDRWRGDAAEEDEKPFSLLLLKGKPGSGKSVAMRAALDTVEGYIKSDHDKSNAWISLSFFFDSRPGSTGNEQSEKDMYKAMLLQLIAKLNTELLIDLKQAILDHQGGHETWSSEGLRGAISLVLGRLEFQKLFIFLDALDECKDLEEGSLFPFFEEMLPCGTGRILRVCLSSRTPLNIEHRSEIAPFNVSEQNKLDIDKFIDKELTKKLGHIKATRPQTFHKIVTRLSDRASNLFLWVDLVIKNILKQYTGTARSEQEILDYIEHIPEGLTDLYKHLLRRIPPDDRSQACNLFLLVQVASKPLTIDAIGSMLDCSRGFTLQEVDIKSRIELFSRGLIECRSARSTPDSTVQFIHKSLGDFLIKDGGLGTLDVRFARDPESQFHLCAFELCMRTINYNIQFGGADDRISFLPYAARFWTEHARQGGGSIPKDFQYPNCLSECDSLDADTIVDLFKKYDRHESFKHCRQQVNTSSIQSEQSLIVLLAFEGCTELVSQHLKSCRQCLSPARFEDARDVRMAFFLAACSGFSATAEAVLDSAASLGVCIDVDAVFGGVTALYKACLKGKTETVEFLVRRGADVHKSLEQKYQFAFHAAAAHDGPGVVEAILRHKRGDPSEIRRLLLARTNVGCNVFHQVVYECRTQVLKLLLQEARGGDGVVVEALLQREPEGNMTAYDFAVFVKKQLEDDGGRGLPPQVNAWAVNDAINILGRVMQRSRKRVS
ncbi:hypothetical protein QQS21_003602 [Conoideocrella luteorostrata]|uniref:Nephrocystin 3-like N-terminal domain-containing protein n=1 Tax=Conoideocrella luteorostrata TaxID=1105319 RepID=A0AAJ0G252_9HYPO|nr:hypothetical protein QQS21_003602 [Conoideocrella luteorostrata]